MQVKDFRVQITGRQPGELTRARGMLTAEIAGTGPRLRPGTAPRRRMLIAAVGTAAAAGLIVGLLGVSPPGAKDGTGQLTAKYVLDRAARAAASRPVPRPGQYIYVKSISSGTTFEFWEPTRAGHPALSHITPPITPGTAWIQDDAYSCSTPSHPFYGSYQWMLTLPTDIGALRAWVYAHPDGQNPPDEQAWNDVTDMLKTGLVPPRIAVALFRVLGTIPGLTVVPHARDALGRAGIGVSAHGDEIILDADSYQMLGDNYGGGSIAIVAVRAVNSAPHPKGVKQQPVNCKSIRTGRA